MFDTPAPAPAPTNTPGATADPFASLAQTRKSAPQSAGFGNFSSPGVVPVSARCAGASEPGLTHATQVGSPSFGGGAFLAGPPSAAFGGQPPGSPYSPAQPNYASPSVGSGAAMVSPRRELAGGVRVMPAEPGPTGRGPARAAANPFSAEQMQALSQLQSGGASTPFAPSGATAGRPTAAPPAASLT